MFKKFLSAIKIVKNKDRIKNVLQETYSALVKTLDALKYLSEQANDTKLGKAVKEHLPKVVEVLTKIKLVFEKFGPYISLNVVVPQQILREETIENNLRIASQKLDEFLKK